MLAKFIAGEAARQHWKKPIVQSEMHIMHFHQLTGYVFVKRANVVLDVDQKRNTCIKAEPIEGQGELWKKKNEHIYTMVRNNHVVKIGGTRVGMKERFGSYGETEEVSVISDKYSGRSKGFGFVTFVNDADADKAIAEMNGKDIEGRPLKVNEAKPREER